MSHLTYSWLDKYLFNSLLATIYLKLSQHSIYLGLPDFEFIKPGHHKSLII